MSSTSNTKVSDKKKDHKGRSKKQINTFAKCRFCDWQFISKSQRTDNSLRMYRHHLERTHKLTKEDIKIITKQSAENFKIVENLNYGQHTNIKFSIEDGNRNK